MANKHLPDYYFNFLGQFCHDLGPRVILNRQEEHELVVKGKAGDDTARNRLFESLIPLVIHLAQERQASTPELSLDDLVQEGFLALYHSFERFDPNRGFKFITFAFRQIRWCLKKSVGRKSSINGAMADRISAYCRAQWRLRSRFGYWPSLEELGIELGMTEENVRLVRKAILSKPKSLNRMIDNSDSEIRSRNPEPEIGFEGPDRELARQHIQESLRCLDFRTRTVLELLYGLSDAGSAPMSFTDIGRMLGITRSAVEQIKNAALNLLHEDRNLQNLASQLVDSPDLDHPPCRVSRYKVKARSPAPESGTPPPP